MALDDIEKFRQTLIDSGNRVTSARVVTFQLLMGKEPQTMVQLLAKAKGITDRVSVYRNIELFEKLGIVHRINIGWKYKIELSDQFIAHHHHLICLKCGKVINTEDEQHISKHVDAIAKKYGFSVRNHQFEIEGYCSDCRSLSPQS